MASAATSRPLILLAVVVVPRRLVAGVLGRVARLGLVVSLPIVVSVALVSILTRPGETVLFELGPFGRRSRASTSPPRSRCASFVMATALILFGLTTEPRAIMADLERRGVSPRVTFAIAATLDAMPAMVDRARAVTAAQRARGLDTEGSASARLRASRRSSARSCWRRSTRSRSAALALEARGFGRLGRREPLWTQGEATWEPAARWLLIAALAAALLAATISGAPAAAAVRHGP